MSVQDWHLLLVDDDEDDYILTQIMLSESKGRKISLIWASTYSEALINLKEKHFDAALVDYDLGGRTGIELIHDLVSAGVTTPLILYTGRGNFEVDVEAMHAGAALYLTKSEANPLLLERAIRYAIERKLAEATIQESKSGYQQLFNSMLDGVAIHEIILDIDGKPVDYRFLEVNPAFEQQTGLKAVDIIGKTVLEILPQTEPYWIRNYGETALTGKAVRFENYAGALDKYFEVIAFSPRPKQFAVVFHDITARKKAEAALRSAQAELEKSFQEHTQLFEELFQSAPDVILLVSAVGKILRVNHQVEEVFGYRQDELVGQDVDLLVPESLRLSHAGLRNGYTEHPSIRRMGKRSDYTGRRKDGDIFPVDITLSPIELGGTTHVICIIRSRD